MFVCVHVDEWCKEKHITSLSLELKQAGEHDITTHVMAPEVVSILSDP
jgi:hypothetical protein